MGRDGVKLIVGNWKMNGLATHLTQVEAVAAALRAPSLAARVAICPPATLVHRCAEIAQGSRLEIGGQDVHAEACGARTGDVAAEMLRDAGATLVIVGHSERRDRHRESDTAVAAKVRAALRAGLEPIICVGETAADQAAGRTLAVIGAQVDGSVPDDLAAAFAGRAFAVAYEPVWAIGSGRIPTTDDIARVHAAVASSLEIRFGAKVAAATPILYGGSVTADNAAEIMATPHVGGVLVGGASLKADSFLPIVAAAAA